MQKICLFTNTLTEGGAERQVIFLANELSHFFDISIVVLYGDRISPNYLNLIDNKSNIQLIRLSGSSFSKWAVYYKFLRKNKPTVIFNYLLIPNLLGGIIARLAGIKHTIGGIRTVLLAKKKVFLNKIAQNFINEYTIYNNQSGLVYYSTKGFDKRKAIYIPNMIPDNSYKYEKRENKIPVILSVGRFIDPKDYISNLDAIKLLAEKGYKFKHIICGWGILENIIREKIKKNGLEDIVELVISPNNLPDYYRQADIFLQTSVFEGLPNTIMEAMSFCLPSVVTDVGDTHLLIVNEVNGYLCEIKQPAQIAERLSYLLENIPLRMEMGRKSYEKIYTDFGSRIFRERYLNFIKKITNEG